MTNNILMLLILGTVGWQGACFITPNVICRPHVLTQCRSLNYSTTLPNLRNQTSPRVIEEEFLQFEILFRYNCSNALLVFLCAIYAPFCGSPDPNSTPVVLKPCRNLCIHVYNGCISVFKEFQYQWPEILTCENFPERSEEKCFGPLDPSDIEYPNLVSPNATISLPTASMPASMPATDTTLSPAENVTSSTTSSTTLSPTVLYLIPLLVVCCIYHMI